MSGAVADENYWVATSKPGKTYLHIFRWPADGTFRVPAIPSGSKIAKVYLLVDPARAPLPVEQAEIGSAMLKLRTGAPDPVATVICLEIQ